MTQNITQTALIDRLQALPTGRHLIALAGAPASGKSTLAEHLASALDAQTPGRAAVLSMDGYHFDDRVLEARGHRPRKGAPHTFDVGGLRHMLARLRANDEAEVTVPIFDRSIEIARAGAAILPRSVEIVIVEGNYLLLKTDPWASLAGAFDLTVMIDVPEAELRRRLLARWEGYDLTPAQIEAKLEDNDLPNGRTVMRDSMAPDLSLQPG